MQLETTTLDDTMLVEDHKSMRDYGVVFTGQSISLLGSKLVQFSLVWWLTTTSGSASILALGSIMAIFPQVLISPLAGALIDRWDRKKVMMSVDAAIASAVLVLAYLYSTGTVQIWHIYAIMLFRAIGGAFQWPAMQASTSLMVPKKHLARVAGLNQALYGFANIIAPPIGAFLIDILPMQSILAIDVVTAIIAIVTLLAIRIPQPVNSNENSKKSVISDMREGLRFVTGWKGIMGIIGMAMIFNLLIIPAMSLTPLLVTEHFGGGAKEYAILEASIGIGMIVGGILLGAWGGFKKKVVTGLSSAVMMGLGTVIVGLAPSNLYVMAVAGMALSGLMSPIVNGSIFSLLQSIVPPEKQGRVFTLVMSGTAAMAPIGLAMAGPISERLGIQIWFLTGGVMIILMGIGAFFVPAIMNIEKINTTPES